MNETTLYKTIKTAGIETGNHESDLYFPVTEKSTEILNQFKLQKNNAKKFKHQETGEIWYDVPFAFDPYWNSKTIGQKQSGKDEIEQKETGLILKDGIENNMREFIGSEHRYRYSNLFPFLLLSDGTKTLAEKHGSYWLFDVIGSYITELKKNKEAFALAVLKHEPEPGKPDRFLFSLQNDMPASIIYASQEIGFSDFPKPGVKLYISLVDENNYLAFLPSEY